jgi:hypothetical protein
MDQRLQYEELIAGKLQQLPVPDMQDQIWERIKFQLDLDMPEDDGPGSTPPAPSGPGIMGWGLAVILIAFISIFIISKNKPSDPATQNNNTPSEQVILPVDQTGAPPGTINTTSNSPVQTNTPGQVLQNNSNDSFMQDNVIVSAPVVLDSVGAKASQDITQIIQPVDTTAVPSKRPRGVQGISANDYRIVPKKDSVNKQ